MGNYHQKYTQTQKALYRHIPKIQKNPVSLSVFGQYPYIPKNPSRASFILRILAWAFIYDSILCVLAVNARMDRDTEAH